MSVRNVRPQRAHNVQAPGVGGGNERWRQVHPAKGVRSDGTLGEHADQSVSAAVSTHILNPPRQACGFEIGRHGDAIQQVGPARAYNSVECVVGGPYVWVVDDDVDETDTQTRRLQTLVVVPVKRTTPKALACRTCVAAAPQGDGHVDGAAATRAHRGRYDAARDCLVTVVEADGAAVIVGQSAISVMAVASETVDGAKDLGHRD